jgi:hypothetical protein
MEAILASRPSNHDVVHPTSPDLSDIYATLSSLLRQLAQSASTPAHAAATSGESPALWLYNKCSSLPSPLGPLQLTLATLAALKSANKEQALFDLFGEQDVELLFEIMGRESELANVSEDDIKSAAGEENNASSASGAASQQDEDPNDNLSGVEGHLYSLRNDAYELANILTTLRQDLPSSSVGPAGSGTHTVMRKSDKEAEKMYKKAVKQAAIAIEKAKEAGALTDGDIKILTALKDGTEIDYSELDSEWMAQRGLDGMDERQIALMMADLAPEGTRVYNSSSQKGLPRGAIREIKEGYEQVIIPAPVLDRSKLPERIVLSEVLGEEERRAFAGTTSLNPMQSTVFDAAYRSRENLLICAPTGAGVSSLVVAYVGMMFVHICMRCNPPRVDCLDYLRAENLLICQTLFMSPVAKRCARKTLLMHNDRFSLVNTFVVIKSTFVSQLLMQMNYTYPSLLFLPENKCCNVSTMN